MKLCLIENMFRAIEYRSNQSTSGAKVLQNTHAMIAMYNKREIQPIYRICRRPRRERERCFLKRNFLLLKILIYNLLNGNSIRRIGGGVEIIQASSKPSIFQHRFHPPKTMLIKINYDLMYDNLLDNSLDTSI